jgi:hypothetical protein
MPRKGAKLAAMVPSDSRQIAGRIRARIEEMGESESGIAEKMGRHRSVLSTTLRKLDEGKGLRTATLARLEKVLGKTQQWILTGEEGEGVRLADLPGWPLVASEAAARHKLAPEVLEAVGRMRVPVAPRVFDAAFVGAIARAWADAT